MSLFSELKRRNVIRVAIAYIALCWVVIQATDIVVPALNLPVVLNSIVVYLAIVGFFFAIFFAWAFELTPDGLKPTKEVPEEESIRASTGQKINRIIIGLMAVAIVGLLIDRFIGVEEPLVDTVSAVDNTIAVMPFTDMSADGSQEYFGDGMAEEILNVLTTIDDLDVTSRTTAFSLKDENLSIPEIAERLDVNYILEGSIRSDGNSVRVTAQLIDVANDVHLWSETFDRELEGIFAIQDEISLSIADALKVELLGDQVGKVPTTSIEAYDLYLQALRNFDVPDCQKVRDAQGMLDRAIELDPDFAFAWAFISGSQGAEITYCELTGEEIGQRLDIAIDAANTAVLLDPGLIDAWATIANMHLQKLQLAQAWAIIERVQQLALDDTGYTADFGLFYTAVGWWDEAIASLERQVEVNPKASVSWSVLGRAYFSNGDMDNALRALNMSIDQDYGAARTNMSMVHLFNGDGDAAKRQFRSQWYSEQNPRRVPDQSGLTAGEYISLMVDGFFDAALREEYSQFLPLAEDPVSLVTGSMLLKDGDHLASWMSDSTFNRYLIITYVMAPPFRDMLNQPAMKEYINSVGLPDFWRNHKWPNFCRPVGDDDYECQDMHGNYP